VLGCEVIEVQPVTAVDDENDRSLRPVDPATLCTSYRHRYVRQLWRTCNYSGAVGTPQYPCCSFNSEQSGNSLKILRHFRAVIPLY
jgi:hypothetical protein